jgi:hypothetical protein
MLAYVFWHWRRADVAAADYEARQRAFHAALTAAPPAGFVSSASAAIAGAPWAHGGGEAYEDWYLVRDSAALDPLNEGAVTAGRARPHDSAAAVAAGGTAGLYRARIGRPAERPRHALWFAKPQGVSYAALEGELAPVAEAARGALWIRQMVLGPSPELCLRTEEPARLPPRYAPIAIALRTVWPADGAVRPAEA